MEKADSLTLLALALADENASVSLIQAVTEVVPQEKRPTFAATMTAILTCQAAGLKVQA